MPRPPASVGSPLRHSLKVSDDAYQALTAFAAAIGARGLGALPPGVRLPETCPVCGAALGGAPGDTRRACTRCPYALALPGAGKLTLGAALELAVAAGFSALGPAEPATVSSDPSSPLENNSTP